MDEAIEESLALPLSPWQQEIKVESARARLFSAVIVLSMFLLPPSWPRQAAPISLSDAHASETEGQPSADRRPERPPQGTATPPQPLSLHPSAIPPPGISLSCQPDRRRWQERRTGAFILTSLLLTLLSQPTVGFSEHTEKGASSRLPYTHTHCYVSCQHTAKEWLFRNHSTTTTTTNTAIATKPSAQKNILCL